MDSLSWEPTPRCRTWMLVGVVALIADLVAGVAATALEFRHWGEEGLTPDEIVSYAAILPQMLVIAAYLTLARDAGARALWKSAAGMLGSYLLFCLIDLVMLEALPAPADTALVIVVAIGIVSLFAFTVSPIPRFQVDTESKTSLGSREADSSSEPGWIATITLVIVLVAVRLGFRKLIQPHIGDFGAGDWATFELFAVALFGLFYAIWFAVVKIRFRATLGRMGLATGVIELLALVIHLAMLCGVVAYFLTEVMANPEITEEEFDGLLEPMFKPASVISTACHVVWAATTVTLFLSIRWRSKPDTCAPQSRTA